VALGLSYVGPATLDNRTEAEVDQVLDTANKIKKISVHPEGNTITVQNTTMRGKPQVVVDAATDKPVISVIKNKR
jgi:hypothetical protein